MPECRALQWTLSSLRAAAGDNEVFVRRDTNCDDYKLGRVYHIEKVVEEFMVLDVECSFGPGSERNQRKETVVCNSLMAETANG